MIDDHFPGCPRPSAETTSTLITRRCPIRNSRGRRPVRGSQDRSVDGRTRPLRRRALSGHVFRRPSLRLRVWPAAGHRRGGDHDRRPATQQVHYIGPAQHRGGVTSGQLWFSTQYRASSGGAAGCANTGRCSSDQRSGSKDSKRNSACLYVPFGNESSVGLEWRIGVCSFSIPRNEKKKGRGHCI